VYNNGGRRRKMNKKRVEKHFKKNVKIVLNSEFIYKGKLVEIFDDGITIDDFKEGLIDISYKSISTIQKNGRY